MSILVRFSKIDKLGNSRHGADGRRTGQGQRTVFANLFGNSLTQRGPSDHPSPIDTPLTIQVQIPIFIRAKNSGLKSTFTGRGAARESFSVHWGSALLRESLEFLYLSALLRGPGPELLCIIIWTCTCSRYDRIPIGGFRHSLTLQLYVSILTKCPHGVMRTLSFWCFVNCPGVT